LYTDDLTREQVADAVAAFLSAQGILPRDGVCGEENLVAM
jgi:hypothetical protein